MLVDVDPLTAVVILSIAGAAAAVAILQMDPDSNGTVDVPVETFEAGNLPAVCCKTGGAAAASVGVEQRRFFRPVVAGIVPVSKGRFAEFSSWQDLYRRALLAFVPLAVVGLAVRFAADSVVVSWAVDIALIAVLSLSFYCKVKARRLLVAPRRNLDGTVALRGLHPAFVDAVRAGASSKETRSG